MGKLKNLTGQKFGRLTVINRVSEDLHGQPEWLCKCDCGNETVVRGYSLIRAKKPTRSCGCLHKEWLENITVDIVGSTFGKWTVLSVEDLSKKRKKYICKCDCGTVKSVFKNSLLSGDSKSCGCSKKRKSEINKKVRTIRSIRNSYKCGAKKRGFDFKISFDDMEKLLFKNCHYCGSPPSNLLGNKYADWIGVYYNGIDRVDNTLGYIDGNIVSCCKTCNRMKMQLTEEDFYNHIKKIYTHTNNNNLN